MSQVFTGAMTSARQLLEHVFDQHSAAREFRSLLHELGQSAFCFTTDHGDIREIDYQLAALECRTCLAKDLSKFTEPRFHQLPFKNEFALHPCIDG